MAVSRCAAARRERSRVAAERGTHWRRWACPTCPRAACTRHGDAGRGRGYDVVETVRARPADLPVHDLDVEPTHNFVAGGIVHPQLHLRMAWGDVRNILDFERDHPDAHRGHLDPELPLHPGILDAAHSVIRNQPRPPPKKLWTERGRRDKVQLLSVYESQEEALDNLAEIDRLRGERGVSLSDCAVLYRTNASPARWRTYAAPGHALRLVGGCAFTERREIKDVLAYLR